MKNIVVAYDNERAIGANGYLLWQRGEMRNDMKHFRELTIGSTLIMGRKTLDSIGIALPDRKTIVLTRSESVNVPGVEVAHSLDEAYFLAGDYEDVFIAGGGEIYEQTINDAQRIHATEIDTTIFGADTYFPRLSNDWQAIVSQEFPADENNKYPYSFVTYERK